MKLNAPKQLSFLIAAAAIAVGIVLYFFTSMVGIPFYLVAGGGVFLAAACFFKGL